MLELHDIPDPDNLLPGVRIAWWGWLLTVISIITLAWLVRRKLARTSGVIPTDSTSYLACQIELNASREKLTSLSLAEVATRCSLALRTYLHVNLDEQALYETHDEFLLRPEALQRLPRGARDHLEPFLSKLAQCKYGPSGTDPAESAKLIDDSLRILHGLESTRGREIQ